VRFFLLHVSTSVVPMLEDSWLVVPYCRVDHFQLRLILLQWNGYASRKSLPKRDAAAKRTGWKCEAVHTEHYGSKTTLFPA
jgi:hypothetical protein